VNVHAKTRLTPETYGHSGQEIRARREPGRTRRPGGLPWSLLHDLVGPDPLRRSVVDRYRHRPPEVWFGQDIPKTNPPRRMARRFGPITWTAMHSPIPTALVICAA
jgi:hypothetical protein